MPNDWDIPPQKHIKLGHDSPDPIYLAVGKALTAWEGLEADLGYLFAVFSAGNDHAHSLPAIRAFGAVNGTGTRKDMINFASAAFFAERSDRAQCENFQAELKTLMTSYTGWSARRNDIAHGYVTENRMPDPFKVDLTMITSYLLCPSHGASRKWPLNWEPNYQFKAEDIDVFARGFEKLADGVRDFAGRVERWRSQF